MISELDKFGRKMNNCSTRCRCRLAVFFKFPLIDTKDNMNIINEISRMKIHIVVLKF